ncbi:MAG TPA: MFS transporter [Bacilli bacterium]|nr:MFS transporter [Bacilli bacterium]
MTYNRFAFLTLVLVVAISGASQGLCLPLLSVLLEQAGVSSVANGFNSTGLFLGILIVSPLVEIPVRRLGYRTTILIGLVLVTVSTLLFPILSGMAIWFALRFLLGCGDVALHYTSQIWVTALAPENRRGRLITFYGFAYGAGFSMGPLGMLLLPYGTWVPFALITVLYLISFVLMLRLPNEFPEAVAETAGVKQENRYLASFKYGWWVLLPSLVYGFMEATLNVNFPVYAMRSGISVEWISVLLPAFAVGSLVLQLPLGALSDRISRKKIMMTCALVGAVAFCLVPLSGSNAWLMLTLLGLAGATVGSFYSLGLALATDVLPMSLVPTVGVIMGMNYSIGSLIGPNVNGVVLGTDYPGGIFIGLAVLLGIFLVSGFLFKQKKGSEGTVQPQSTVNA